jgi:hypothetical protein
VHPTGYRNPRKQGFRSARPYCAAFLCEAGRDRARDETVRGPVA